MDPRLAAFLGHTAPEIFHSVEHRQEIWTEDPFDVTSVHAEARDAFERLLAQATTPPGLPSGRILLLLGESGAGKTHLLRAFRNRVHESGDGFVSYLQMTTATPNYGRYLLVNLIDSLDQPYFSLLSEESGLGRLSKVLAARCQNDWMRKILTDDDGVEGDELAQVVRDLADELVADPRFADQDLDLIRALLFLQRRDPRLKARVLKYLRGENLGEADRAMLGGIVPRNHEEDAQRVVEAIGRLAWTLCGKSLVLCVDQLEDMYSVEDSETNFRRAMAAIAAVCDRVPSAIVVICCLEDFWEAMKPRLTRSIVDRIERDPDKLVLRSLLDGEEVQDIVGKRLEHLYDRLNVPFDPSNRSFPFPRSFLSRLAGLRTRDVLDECRRFREGAQVACGIPEETAPAPVAAVNDRTERTLVAPPTMLLEQAWNDFYAGFDAARPEAEEDIAALLAWALGAAAEELGGGKTISARPRDGFIDVDVITDGKSERLLVAVVNRASRGGALGKQITRLTDDLSAMRPRPTVVLARTHEFPTNPKAEITRQIGSLVAKGGRRTQVEDSDLLRMLALRAFRAARAQGLAFAAWLEISRPLARLRSIREILDLGAAPREESPPPSVATRPGGTTQVDLPLPTPGIVVGETVGLLPKPVTLDLSDFTRHAAFLGGSGSGKTTLVMGLVEQLLLAGIPAIVVDRKGDLAGYLRDEAWRRPVDPPLAERRDRLRAAIDPVLYTPGHPEGRPLGIDLAPAGMGDLPEFERREEALHAASALAGMLDYRNTARHKAQKAILAQAFDLLTQTVTPLDLETLVRFIDSADPALVGAVGRLDTRHFRELVRDLETLRLSGSKLFTTSGDRLDVPAMLAPPRGGKTRLTIISTQWLGDSATTLFWVAQLMLAVTRYITRHPAPRLQGVVLLDEADLYLPATSQPATKAPMENLLKRARSTGLGVLLATQSPGDLDYKCRDSITSWFIGRVKEPTALAKLKPMLASARADLATHIAAQKPREFALIKDGVATELHAASSCIAPEQIPEQELLALARKR
jgi:energy-coupling factor transporter ATP-binding protein EcfA2